MAEMIDKHQYTIEMAELITYLIGAITEFSSNREQILAVSFHDNIIQWCTNQG